MSPVTNTLKAITIRVLTKYLGHLQDGYLVLRGPLLGFALVSIWRIG